MLRRLPTLLVGLCLLATAAPLALGAERPVGPAPVDMMFVDPLADGLAPRLPFGGGPGADVIQAQEIRALPFAAPAFAAGLTDTLLRATGFIPDAQYNVGLRVALDRDQVPNPIVAGYYYNPTNGQHYNGVLVKFNGQGEMAYNAGVHFGDFEVLYGAATDAANNAFGGGYAFDRTDNTYKFLAAKVDSAGSILWQRMVGAPDSFYSIGSDVAVDSAGNAIVAGLAVGSGAFNYDAGVVKFDPHGNVVFAKRLNLPATQEYVLGVAVDGQDNILLGGIDFSTGGYLPMVLKLDPAGNVLGRTTIDVPNAIAYGIAVGSDGSIALGGYRFDSPGIPQLGQVTRAFVARLNPDLSLDWQQGVIVGAYTIGLDVGMDSRGDIVVGGYALSGELLGGYDAFLAKISAAGPVLWTRLIERDPTVPLGQEIAYGAAVSADGLFVATGGYGLVDNTYGIFASKGLGVSIPGAVGGALNTAANARGIAGV